MTRFLLHLRKGLPAMIGLAAVSASAQYSQGNAQALPPPAAVPNLTDAPLVAEPALGRLQIFDDWAVACDNRLSCSAVSLTPEGVQAPHSVLVSVRRSGGPAGATALRVLTADQLRDRIDFIVDGTRRVRQKATGDMIEVTGAEALDLVRALGSSYIFELQDRRRQVIGTPSLRGLPAALRYMDEQQGRIGSSGALAAIGDGPADMARPLPPGPVLPAEIPMLADVQPPVLTEEEQSAARRLAQCESGLESSHPLEVHALDAGHALVLLPCDAGAYNVSAVPLVAAGGAGAWQFHLAPFDHVPGFTHDAGAPPLIVNARWNPARGELSSFAKGRGLGDCGTAETYRWDGARFRLTEARSMPVCRGAWEWPVLYSRNMQGSGAAQQ